MNSLEERLSQLEYRLNRYRNLNIFLCLLLVATITIAATEGVPSYRQMLQTAPVKTPERPQEAVAIQGRDHTAQATAQAQRATKVLAQTQDVVRTRALQIVNNTGQVVVELTSSTSDGGLIFVNNSEGKTLTYIGSSASNGNGLVLVNSTEDKNLIALGSDGDTGDGYINIRNRNEERMITFSTDEVDGLVEVYKAGNQRLAYLGGSASHNGLFTLYNEEGKRMVVLSAGTTSGDQWMYNADDVNIAYLGSDIDGQGRLAINSKTGTELVYAGSNINDDGLLRVANRFGVREFVVVGSEENGVMWLSDNKENTIAHIGATTSGNGILRTLTPQGIITWSSTAPQTSSPSKPGDMDNDGDIDGDDFLLFSENFGKR